MTVKSFTLFSDFNNMRKPAITLYILLLLTLITHSFAAQNPPATRPAADNGQNRTNNGNSNYPYRDSHRLPDNPNFLPPRHTLSLPHKNYYIDRAGNYVYYGKPLKTGNLNITYLVDNVSYSGIKYSIRYFYTPRVTNDDLFDNLAAHIEGENYKGAISQTYRFLNKGNPYINKTRNRIYLPHTFIRFEIKTPEGTKYIISPSLDRELIYPIDEAELNSRAKLILTSFMKFRQGISDLMLYEHIRYSAVCWITLKRSNYENINSDKIIWHYLRKPVVDEQNISGNLKKIEKYLKEKGLTFDKNKLSVYYKQDRYQTNPLNAKYYLFKFRLNDKIQYILSPVDKTYHNASNRPIKEVITYYARKFLQNPNSSMILAAKEKPFGTWIFTSVK